jgi:Ca-activated chloride channel family protein
MTTPQIPIVDLPEEDYSRSCGVLTALRAAHPVALPLEKVDIQARVVGQIAEVIVQQTFRNEHSEALEAVYIFPLSGGSAVSGFEMRVGSRILRGQVEERAQARQQYQDALQAGKRSALLEQERDDVFTLQVGNIPPGEQVEIKITYSERLSFFENGTTELRLPTVVAPRYVPGRPLDSCDVGDGIEEDTDIVPDASRISPPRLAKGFDPKVGLNIQVELLADGIRELSCSQHATRTSTSDSTTTRVSLVRTDELLNRDFVLRWKLSEDKVKTSLHTFQSKEGSHYAMLSILPPRGHEIAASPRDVLFILDRSGSMLGVKMASASKACSTLLSTLGPADRFGICCFNNRVDWFYPDGKMGSRFLPADEAGLKRGEEYLRGITSEGGTELDRAVEAGLAALSIREDEAERIPVAVLLTDGQISDESRVLSRIKKDIGKIRIFTVGIDTAVNQSFLKRLADLSGGTSTFVEPGAPLDDALRAISREIGAPLIVDLAIQGMDSIVESIAPSRIPDLFTGRSSVTLFQTKQPGPIRVKGKFNNGKVFEQVVAPEETSLSAISHLWARARVRDLEDQFRMDSQSQEKTKKQIIEIAIQHTLLTRFTAFIVVDESEVVNQDGTRRKIVQPVEMPAQWEMDMSPSMPITGAFKLSTMALPSAPMEARAPSAPSPMMQLSDTRRGPISALKGLLRKIPERQKRQDEKALRQVVREFMRLFESVMNAVHSGRIPPAKELEKAKNELLKLLKETSTEYAAVKRFVETTVTELLLELKSAHVDVDKLQNILSKNQKTIDDAFREVHPFAGTPPFWESTI